jgi:hypothetical protein
LAGPGTAHVHQRRLVLSQRLNGLLLDKRFLDRCNLRVREPNRARVRDVSRLLPYRVFIDSRMMRIHPAPLHKQKGAFLYAIRQCLLGDSTLTDPLPHRLEWGVNGAGVLRSCRLAPRVFQIVLAQLKALSSAERSSPELHSDHVAAVTAPTVMTTSIQLTNIHQPGRRHCRTLPRAHQRR